MLITAFANLDARGNKIFIFFVPFQELQLQHRIEKEKKISTIIPILVNYMFI
jgi:hypothetical protein